MRSACHRIVINSLVICAMTSARVASAGDTAGQPAPPATPAASPRDSEAEYLVPPQGGAFEIALHIGEVCILSFPDKVSNKALVSSPDFQIKAWEEDGIAVRALGATAKTTTLAVATVSGSLKVNLTLVVVPADKPSLKLVRFKAGSEDDFFDFQLQTALAPFKADLARQGKELDRQRKELDDHIRERAEGQTAEGALKRSETCTFSSHARNADNVIVHVVRGLLVGEEGYVIFELENRSGSPYRVASVRVQAEAHDVSGLAKLTSATNARDPNLLGVVPAGATGRGVVVVRSVDHVLGKNLTLDVAGAPGSQPIRIDQGIVFR